MKDEPMRCAFNAKSLEAFEQLLALPDPADLPRRGHTLRWEGEANRRVTRLLPLVMCWLQQHLLKSDGEEPLVPAAIQTQIGRVCVAASGPRLLPWTGTPHLQAPGPRMADERRRLSAVRS